MFDDAYARGWQLINHANGDAAIDQLIRAACARYEGYLTAQFRSRYW
ncbi:MAG: hypothetical protein P8125_12860 [Gemmatimonadota bacterium]|jgi:predicted amidohydrolase YtcJ